MSSSTTPARGRMARSPRSTQRQFSRRPASPLSAPFWSPSRRHAGCCRAGRGAILLTGATAGVKGFPLSSAFAMGKFGLRGLAQSAARELGPKGIHVAHFVIDGAVRSDRRPEAADRPDSTLSRTASRKPIWTCCGSRATPGRSRSSYGPGWRNSEGSGSAVGTASLGRAGEIESPNMAHFHPARRLHPRSRSTR